MGKASPVIPGASWELTRRCVERRFLLRPDPEVRSALLYCFAYCSTKYQVLQHALEIMGNHHHNVITDPLGNRNDYAWELHSLIAKCIQKLRGEEGKPLEGPVWEPNESYGRIWMASEAAFVDSIAYVLANPVAAGLVERPTDWPGFGSTPEDMLHNRQITVSRPDCLGAPYPATASLRFCVPPAFAEKPTLFVDAVKRRLKERVQDARDKMRVAGSAFQGPALALDVSPFESPKTRKKRNTIRPQFRATMRKAIALAKKTMVAWHRAYRLAFEAFRKGSRRVEWPAGTWWFERYAGASVAPASTWHTFGAS